MNALKDPKIWWKVAAVSGAAAVGAGAYGTHGFKPSDPKYKEMYDIANRYHLIHSGVLLVAPFCRRPHVVGGLFSVGTLLFSGSCYATALTEDRKYSKPAPTGGVSLVLAWLSILL